MATISQCPACGEDQHLRGSPSGDDIEVTCETCGARWLRGATRCNSCGRTDSVIRPQVMTRHPRGNQLAIVGRRQLPLCPVCDADAIAESETGNRPVPERYVSVFLFGRELHRHVAPQPASREPASSTDAVPAGRRTGPSVPGTPEPSAPRTGQQSSAHPQGRARPARPEAARPGKEQGLARPTVRQAIEAYLSDHPDADSLAMLFLGQHLGPASRLEAFNRPEASDSLLHWFDATWDTRQAERRRTAAAAITEAVDHWRAHGWITEDLAVGLR